MIEHRGIREPKIVDEPWGKEVCYAHTDRYAGKILQVDEGHTLSLQKNEMKHEIFFLLEWPVSLHAGRARDRMAPRRSDRDPAAHRGPGTRG